MPWREMSAVDARNAFIDAYLRREVTMTALCAEFGISRDKGYKWVRRYDQEGRAGLLDRPKIAHSLPQATKHEVIEIIVASRRRFPNWGPRKLKAFLEREHQASFPAASSIGRILSERGLSSPQRRDVKTPARETPLADYERSNRVWCADFKGAMVLRKKGSCSPLTISDGYSRYLLRCVGMKKLGFEAVKPVFESAFEEFGLPDIIRTDNGPPFASRAPGGYSKLSIWWMKLGISAERIRPGKPTENGRHERIHRTLKQETGHLPRVTFDEQQRRFDRFVHVYNDLRPHESLGNQRPKDFYIKSHRRYPCPLREPQYAPGYRVRVIRPSGEMTWKNRMLFVSEALAGQRVGVRWYEPEQTWLLEFGDLLIGRISPQGRFLRSSTTKKPGV